MELRKGTINNIPARAVVTRFGGRNMRVTLVFFLSGAEGSSREGAFLGVGVAHPCVHHKCKIRISCMKSTKHPSEA